MRLEVICTLPVFNYNGIVLKLRSKNSEAIEKKSLFFKLQGIGDYAASCLRRKRLSAAGRRVVCNILANRKIRVYGNP